MEAGPGKGSTEKSAPTRPSLRRRIAQAVPPPGPIRVLQTNTLIASTGYGLYISGGALFFVQVTGLSQTRVGLGFSLAGLLGLLLSLWAGRLADRWGPREVFLGFSAVLVSLLLAAVFVDSYLGFLAVIMAIGCAETGTTVARGAVTGAILPKDTRVHLAAVTRVLTNIGFSVGVIIAGTVIGIGTTAAYSCLILGMAVTCFLAGLSSLRLPRIPPARAKADAGRRTRSRYDIPYMAVSFVGGLALIGHTVLTVGLPLWIIDETSLPRPLAAWMILGNTVLVILLQVRTARGSATTDGARRMQRRAFVVLAGACAVAPLTRVFGTVAAAAALLVAVGLLTLGELWGESANWSFRYGLADSDAHGAYSGMYVFSSSLPVAAAPVLVTFLTGRFGTAGWLALALVFLVGLAVNGPAISWAERTRGTAPEPDAKPAASGHGVPDDDAPDDGVPDDGVPIDTTEGQGR
ncbi:MFS transporter [Streptomyces sp. NPDC048514]|uniref:MFS transporter n=1 Tax=Streptomyces sp. NPDC048514 TaxID=3365564 RepID=UPI003717D8C6